MRNEVYSLKTLRHSGVVKLFDVVETPKFLFLAMEYASNGRLLDFIKSREKLPESLAAEICLQCIQALMACHRGLIVHRDVKLDVSHLSLSFFKT